MDIFLKGDLIIFEGIMKEEAKKYTQENNFSDRFTEKARLNLNDLLKRRSEEKKIDKKTNLLILLGAGTVGAIVILILSF